MLKIIKTDQEQKEDLKFWSTKTAVEKLEAIQFLREQYIQLFNKQEEYDESRKRLRRVYRIIKQT
jgi:hypothetical protein